MVEFRVGIAGLGVVGGGLLQILITNADRMARTGNQFTVAGVSARSRTQDRGVALDDVAWFDDPVALAKSDDIDIFVELIGGSDGSARAAVEAALTHNKHVVTANKALIAEHGSQLAKLAEDNNVCLLYEAAVAGGVPVIRALQGGAGACDVSEVVGILNGTCNYILSEMAVTGDSYENALEDAKRLGYAEADPSFDVGGVDAAHKLAILAKIAFDADIAFSSVSITGIEDIQAEDVLAADHLGYKIKLIGVAKANMKEQGSGLELRVHPALIPEDHAIAQASGPGNVVMIESDPLGTLALSGPGAGAGATAAAVAADLLSIARGMRGPVFNTPAEQLRDVKISAPEKQQCRFYARLRLQDVPGAIASVTDTLAKHDVSIDSLVQPSAMGAENGEADVVLTTHETTLAAVLSATTEIAQKPFSKMVPSVIRIEDL